MSSQDFHTDERLQVFVLSASALGMASSMRVNSRKDIQAVKSARPVLNVTFA